MIDRSSTRYTFFTATAVLFLVVISAEVVASSAPEAELGERVTTALNAALGGDFHLAVRVAEKKAETGLAGASIVIGGASRGLPFEGDLEVLNRESERFVFSRAALPGFASLEHRGERARTSTYSETPLEFEPVIEDLDRLLEIENLLRFARVAEWSAQPAARTEGTVATARLDPNLLAKSRTRSSGFDLGSTLGGEVLSIRAVVALGAAGDLTAATFAIERSDPIAGLVRRGGMPGAAPTDAGATRTYSLRPIEETVGKRGARLRLELLGAIAESMRAKAGDETDGGPSEGTPAAGRFPPRVSPPTPPTPRERAAASFRTTIARVDRDGDGQISPSEAGDRWERLGKYDTDSDGRVTLGELLAAYDRKQAEAEAKAPSEE